MRVLSPRQASWFPLHAADRLSAKEHLYGEQLLREDREIRAAIGLAQEFGLLVRAAAR